MNNPYAPKPPQAPQPGAFGAYGDKMDDIDPEMLGWLLEAYGGQLEGGEIDDQLAQARALRDRGMDQPGGRQAGRVFVAQNPLETLAATMQGRKGMREEEELMKRRRELNTEQGRRAAEYGARAFGGMDGDADPMEESPYGPKRRKWL